MYVRYGRTPMVLLRTELTECRVSHAAMPRGANLKGPSESSDRYSAKKAQCQLSGAAAGQHAAAQHIAHAHDNTEEALAGAAAAREHAAVAGVLQKYSHPGVHADPVVTIHDALEAHTALLEYNELCFERVAAWHAGLSWPEACRVHDARLLERVATRSTPLSTSTRRCSGGDQVADAVVSHVGWMSGQQEGARTFSFCEDSDITHVLTCSAGGVSLGIAVLSAGNRRGSTILSLHAYPASFETASDALWREIKRESDGANIFVTINTCLSTLWFFPLREWGFQPGTCEAAALFSAYAEYPDVRRCPKEMVARWERGTYFFVFEQ